MMEAAVAWDPATYSSFLPVLHIWVLGCKCNDRNKLTHTKKFQNLWSDPMHVFSKQGHRGPGKEACGFPTQSGDGTEVS